MLPLPSETDGMLEDETVWQYNQRRLLEAVDKRICEDTALMMGITDNITRHLGPGTAADNVIASLLPQ